MQTIYQSHQQQTYIYAYTVCVIQIKQSYSQLRLSTILILQNLMLHIIFLVFISVDYKLDVIYLQPIFWNNNNLFKARTICIKWIFKHPVVGRRRWNTTFYYADVNDRISYYVCSESLDPLYESFDV